MSRRRPSPWIPVAMIGAVAGVFGVALLVKNASAKEAPPPSPLLTPVTDSTEVRRWQTLVAEAAKSGSALPIGISIMDYGPSDVDGNPTNPKWVSVLAKIQTFVNTLLPNLSEQERAKIPTDYPTQLRTDGVLDNATAIALDHL